MLFCNGYQIKKIVCVTFDLHVITCHIINAAGNMPVYKCLLIVSEKFVREKKYCFKVTG